MTTCLQCGHEDATGFLFCPKCGTKAVEGGASKDPLLGRILNGKYRVEGQIGQGAMGTVYLGEHIGLKKKVALKVLHPDLQVSDESLQRFQREGMAAGRFNHPHAIQIFDFDKGDGRVFYLAMEYVDGVDLGLFLRQRGRLPVAVAVPLMRQVVSCLAEAHRHGIVHRDLKPDNIMVTEGSRGELRAKVLDFGLSKLVDRRMGSSVMTQPGRLLGTPLYMAPEQAAGDEADARSDVYAAGLILYEMLAGERPFKEKDSAQLFVLRPGAEAPSLRADRPELDVPEELDHLLQRALERERERRWTADELLSALDELPLGASASVDRSRGPVPVRRPPAASTPAASTAPAAPSVAPEPAPRRRRRWVKVAVLVLALLLVRLGREFFDGESSAGGRPARARLIAAEERSEQEQRYLELLDEACVALRGSDPTAALNAVNQAFLLDCSDAEAFLVRAEIYRARGDLDTAVADFTAAASADADFAEPLLGLGWIQLERGALGEAEATFARAGEIAPESAAVLAARGALAWKRGDGAGAEALLLDAARREPTCAPAHLYLGRLRLDRGDADGSIAALVAAKRNDPFATRPLLWLAEAYLAKEDLDAADKQLEQALVLEPGAAEVRVQRGALLLERGRTADALAFLVDSTERVPREGRLWILRGLAAHESDDDEGAITWLARGFEQGARDPEARCLLGLLYHRQGKLAEAIAQYEAAIVEGGELPLANLDLGLALFAQGKYTEAAGRLDRVLLFDEENAAAHFHLGLLWKDYLGDPARAARHLERYQALGGDDERVAGWLGELR